MNQNQIMRCQDIPIPNKRVIHNDVMCAALAKPVAAFIDAIKRCDRQFRVCHSVSAGNITADGVTVEQDYTTAVQLHLWLSCKVGQYLYSCIAV